jgi:hypothetical protein
MYIVAAVSKSSLPPNMPSLLSGPKSNEVCCVLAFFSPFLLSVLRVSSLSTRTPVFYPCFLPLFCFSLSFQIPFLGLSLPLC